MSQLPWCNAEYWSLTGNIWRHIWEHSWCHYLPLTLCIYGSCISHHKMSGCTSSTGQCVQAVADISAVAVCPAHSRGWTALTCLPGVWNMAAARELWTQHSWSLHRDTLNMQLLWVLLLGFQGCQPGRCCSCSGLSDTWKSQINGQVLSFYLKVSRCE